MKNFKFKLFYLGYESFTSKTEKTKGQTFYRVDALTEDNKQVQLFYFGDPVKLGKLTRRSDYDFIVAIDLSNGKRNIQDVVVDGQ